MSGSVQRALSVKFNGLPTLKELISEMQKVANYVPEYTKLAEFHDNGSAKDDLREITFHFLTEKDL